MEQMSFEERLRLHQDAARAHYEEQIEQLKARAAGAEAERDAARDELARVRGAQLLVGLAAIPRLQRIVTAAEALESKVEVVVMPDGSVYVTPTTLLDAVGEVVDLIAAVRGIPENGGE